MANKKRARPNADTLARTAVLTGGGGGDADAEPDLLPTGLPKVSLKLPKSASQPTPKVRMPTAAEQLQLRAGDSAELVHSNLLHMQLEALLDEVCVDYAPASTKPLDDWLRAFRTALLALPAGEPLVEGDELPLRSGVTPLDWLPPARVALTGSYLLRTQVQPSLNVDLLIELPRACLREKDYLDGRYTDRRQLWLHHLAVLLSHPRAATTMADEDEEDAGRAAIATAAALCSTVGMVAWYGDASWPVIVLRPAALTGMHAAPWPHGLTVRLLPFVALDALALSKLRPGRPCYRGQGAAGGAASSSDAAIVPSALYNARLLGDAAHAVALESLHAVFARDARGALRDAVILLKLWCRQRGFGGPVGSAGPTTGLTPFACTVLVAALTQQRILSPAMSAYQAFRVTMHWLAGADRLVTATVLTVQSDSDKGAATSGKVADALVLKPAQAASSGEASGEAARAPYSESGASALLSELSASGAHPLILLEPLTGCNLAASVSAGALGEIRHEARIAVKLLKVAIPARAQPAPDGAAPLADANGSSGGGGGGGGGGGESAEAAAAAELAAFEALFVHAVRPELKWDLQLSLRVPACSTGARPPLSASSPLSLILAPGTSGLPEAEARLLDIEALLRRALGDRVTLIRVDAAPLGESAPARAPARQSLRAAAGGGGDGGEEEEEELCVRMLLQPDMMAVSRQVDRGPQDAEEAAAYGSAEAGAAARDAVREWQAFWGPRSEQRRFKDGLIVHAVVWAPEAGDGTGERLGVLCRIAEYALSRHLPTPRAIFRSRAISGHERVPAPIRVSWPLGSLLSPLAACGADAGRSAALAANQAFERLCAVLRRLRELPLNIVDIRATAPALRYTAEPPPRPLGSGVAPPAGAEPLRFVIVLEGSGKWPTDPEAVSALRAALHVRIAERLREVSGTGAFAPGSAPDAVSAGAEHVDVLLDGFALRGSVTYDEHLAVVARAASIASAALAARTGEADAEVEAAARLRHVSREHVALPVFAASLRQQVLSRPALALGCRLAKRWVSRHLLSVYLTDESVEALCARGMLDVELTGDAYQPTHSATVCLLRFWQLLAGLQSNTQPLHVPLASELQFQTRSGALVDSTSTAQGLLSAGAAASASALRPSAGGSAMGRGPAEAPAESTSARPLLRLLLPELRKASGGLDVAALCCDRHCAAGWVRGGSADPAEGTGAAQEGAGMAADRIAMRRLSRLAQAALNETTGLLAFSGPGRDSAGADEAGEAMMAPDSNGCPPAVRPRAERMAEAVGRAFLPDLAEYDVLLHLNKTAARELSAHNGDGLTGFKNLDALSAAGEGWAARLGTDRVSELVAKLEMEFGGWALFFLDRLEGKAIALRWKPTAFVPQPFRVGQLRSMIVLASSPGSAGLMVPDALALLQGMLDLGHDLLSNAEPMR